MIRIIVVDDHEPTRRMVSMYLQQAGFEVVGEAENGQQGLNLATIEQPHIVVSDIDMPELTGPEMIEVLVRSGVGANMGFVLLTNGNGCDSTILELLRQQGRLHQESKPVSRKFLTAAVNKVHNHAV